MPRKPASAPAPLADQLLDAQVQWTRERLQGDGFGPELDEGIDAFLSGAAKLKLKAVVAPAEVKAVARRYAVELKPGGEIPALVGEIWRKLYVHKVHERTRLSDLLPDEMFEEFLDKLLELRTLRETLIHEAISNPIYAELISRLLFDGVRDYVAGSEVTKKIPGASRALRLGKAVVRRARPQLGEQVEEQLRAFARRNTEQQLRNSEAFLNEMFEGEQLRELVLDLWHEHKDLTVSSLRDFAGSRDGEELFVIGYEYWLHFRQTEFFGSLLDAGVDAFYARHGNTPVPELLDAIGVTPGMLSDEARRFGPPALRALDKAGLLEPMIRRQLEPFYRSEAVMALLPAG